MLASRRLVVAAQRRAIASLSIRGMATVGDDPLSKKVKHEQLGGEQLYQLQAYV